MEKSNEDESSLGEERAEHLSNTGLIADTQLASICIEALKRDVFALLHEAAEYNVTI